VVNALLQLCNRQPQVAQESFRHLESECSVCSIRCLGGVPRVW
jgi:hypothetical protein